MASPRLAFRTLMPVVGKCRPHQYGVRCGRRSCPIGKSLHDMLRQYMAFPASETDQPPRHLRGYSKPHLVPNQTVTVEFELVSKSTARSHRSQQRKKDLCIWDVTAQVWRVPCGAFTLFVGNSSRHLPLQGELYAQTCSGETSMSRPLLRI